MAVFAGIYVWKRKRVVSPPTPRFNRFKPIPALRSYATNHGGNDPENRRQWQEWWDCKLLAERINCGERIIFDIAVRTQTPFQPNRVALAVPADGRVVVAEVVVVNPPRRECLVQRNRC